MSTSSFVGAGSKPQGGFQATLCHVEIHRETNVWMFFVVVKYFYNALCYSHNRAAQLWEGTHYYEEPSSSSLARLEAGSQFRPSSRIGRDSFHACDGFMFG